MFHVITRPFEGKEPFKVGQIVETEGWRYVQQLTERRFIRPATETEIAAATAPEEASSAPVRRGRPANAE